MPTRPPPLIDDPSPSPEAERPMIRQRTLDWWDRVITGRRHDPTRDTRVRIMQRPHEGDLCGHVLPQDDHDDRRTLSMTPDAQHQLIIDRFAHWMTQLRALEATPFILIGVTHTDHRLHVFVPHHDPLETALMVDTLRKIADDLEAHGPDDPERR